MFVAVVGRRGEDVIIDWCTWDCDRPIRLNCHRQFCLVAWSSLNPMIASLSPSADSVKELGNVLSLSRVKKWMMVSLPDQVTDTLLS